MRNLGCVAAMDVPAAKVVIYLQISNVLSIDLARVIITHHSPIRSPQLRPLLKRII